LDLKWPARDILFWKRFSEAESPKNPDDISITESLPFCPVAGSQNGAMHGSVVVGLRADTVQLK
jgi:hypothetical protein